MHSIDLSLILPCYNEASHIEDSVARIKRILDRSGLSYELVFVDDKSTDGTGELIEDVIKFFSRSPLAESKKTSYKTVGIASARLRQDGNDPSIGSGQTLKETYSVPTFQESIRPPGRCFGLGQAKAVFHKKNMGRGRTVCDGIKVAKGKVAGYIDIDLEVSPVYIPQIADIILSGKADMVIGKRIYRTTFMSIIREILSVGYQMVADRLLDTGKLDTESGYKFFGRKKILPVIKKTRHPHWFWDTEVTVLALRSGLKVAEEPVLFLRRFDKKSTVKVFRDTIDYMVSLWKFRKRLKQYDI